MQRTPEGMAAADTFELVDWPFGSRLIPCDQRSADLAALSCSDKSLPIPW
jgi:hypothetical protein